MSGVIQPTSTKAYHELKDERILGERMQRVLELIERYPGKTDRELAKLYTQVFGGDGDPNNVRPRRTELLKQGYIELAGARHCAVTGRTAMTWQVREKDEQGRLF